MLKKLVPKNNVFSFVPHVANDVMLRINDVAFSKQRVAISSYEPKTIKEHPLDAP